LIFAYAVPPEKKFSLILRFISLSTSADFELVGAGQKVGL
jgi:hypothetical protein